MASPNPNWKNAAYKQLDQDLERGVPEVNGVAMSWTYLTNELAANDILGSRAEAQAFLEDLFAGAESHTAGVYGGELAACVANVTFTSLPFIYTP